VEDYQLNNAFGLTGLICRLWANKQISPGEKTGMWLGGVGARGLGWWGLWQNPTPVFRGGV